MHALVRAHVQPLGLLWTSDQHVAKAANYTIRNKDQRRTSMPSEGFKPAIPAVKRLQTYALGRTATAITFFFHNRSRKPREGVKIWLYSFFNLSARWGRWSTTRFTPGKETVSIVQ